MAYLMACAVCGGPLSTSCRACPRCGDRPDAQRSPGVAARLAMAVAFVLIMLAGFHWLSRPWGTTLFGRHGNTVQP